MITGVEFNCTAATQSSHHNIIIYNLTKADV